MKRTGIVISLLVIVGCASIEIPDSTSVVDLPGQSKQMIYQKAMQWITYKFVSGRAVMDYKDPATGRIIAKGALVLNKGLERVEVDMVATVDCIERKSKILVESTNCSAVAPNGSKWPCTGMYVTAGMMEEVQVLPERFTEEYKLYMTGGRAPAWDGR